MYIPEKYLGYPVTAIGFEAFKNNNIVEYVDADYIITIEDSAFENANRLKEINLDSIESIGNYSFKNAISIERMKLPNSITKLGVSAFENTYEMKEFSFSDNTNIDILPDLLFKSSGIKELLVPTSVVIIGEQAFEQSKIASIVFENDSNLENIGKYAFREAEELIEIEIPEGVTAIKEGTFYRASKLEHLFLPESLLEIEKEAFRSSRINDLLIPKNVELIGELALSSLINLESLVIEDNSKLRELGKDVLYRTRNLKKIVIPNSVEKIGSGAFNEMSSLEYLSIPFVGPSRNGGKLEYFFGRTSYTNSYPVISSNGNYYYLPISLKTVLINDSESIREDAFRATRYVENVYFSETVLFVEKEIFALHSSAMIFTEHKGKPTGWKFSNGTIIFNGSWEFDQDGVPKLL